MTVKNFYKDTAQIYRETVAEGFHTSQTWTLVDTVDCDVDSIPIGLRFLTGNGKTLILDATMYTEYLDMEQGDRVKVFYNKYSSNFEYFDVILIDKPRGRH